MTVPKVAVTGGLSCGKSTACRFFNELGAYVVSADEVVHKLLSPHTNLGQQLIDLIGVDIVVDQKIDRSLIAKKVFNQPELLQKLENLLHPAVRAEIEKLYQHVKKANLAPVFIAEIPLLFETGSDRFFDKVIVVTADEADCQERFTKKTNYDKAEYNKRMARQMALSDKASRADYVIHNNGSLEDLREAVEKIFKNLCIVC